jgi:hypothetical protein
MLLREDVEDDLLEEFGMYYRKEGMVLMYQNGADSDRYLVEIKVHNIGKKDFSG